MLTTDERERMVVEHLPLVRALARRYAGRGEPLDDLVQAGSVGLVKAVDRFDPGRGADLAAFATPAILGEIRRHFRDTTWTVHVPRRAGENWVRILRAADEMARRGGHAPTVGQAAATAGLSDAEAADAVGAGAARSPLSLSAGAGDGDGPAPVAPPVQHETGYAAAEARADLAGPLAALPARERVILHLRFQEDMTQREIADRVGISQMHVSRLIRRALSRLRGSVAGRAPARRERGPRPGGAFAAR